MVKKTDFVEEHPVLAPDREPNANHENADPARFRRRAFFLNADGQEIPDPRPLEPPIGYIKQPSMVDIVREQIALANRLYAEDREFEEFEESEDFDVQDDFDPTSPWENDFDPSVSAAVVALEAEKARKASESPPDPKPTVPAPIPSAPPLAQDKP